jgi:hypothetical protein
MGRHVKDPPVFVIHGIANRDPAQFDRRVRKLADDMGRADVHPVFWGDLGADHQWVPKVVPPVGRDTGRPTRDAAGQPEATELDELAVAMVAASEPGTRGDVESVLAGVRQELGAAAAGGDPRTGDDEFNGWVLAAVEDAWLDPALGWLWSIGDPDLLAELGAAVARATVDLMTAEDQVPVRSPDHVRSVVGAVLRQSDRVAAATMGTAAARFVSWARVRAAPAVAMNVGDLLGYHRHRREILDRVRATIADRVGPDAGRDGTRRVHLVGHSLGAVIALDAAAAADDPVHTASIVTFGSHWSLLHLWRPDGRVPRFDGQPVSLPPTIRRWTNLWERLDLLAFLAEPLFVLPDGTRPRDVELRQGYAETMFSHSVYWDSPLLLAELARAWSNDHRRSG